MVTFATFLLVLLLLGYAGLSGLDLGACLLLRRLGRDAAERDVVLGAVLPYFLANEVWLVLSVGFAAGAFPGLEKTTISPLYPVLMLLLFGWLVRDLGLWLRGRVDRAGWRGFWDRAIVAGAWTVVAAWGLTLGNVLRGTPEGTAPLALFTPFPLLCAVFTLSTVAGYGAWYTRRRLRGEPGARAAALASRLRWAGLAAAIPALVWGLVGGDLLAGGPPLTASVAAENSLRLVVVATVVLLPLLAAAQLVVWRTFRGPVDRVVANL
ncbi:cytochrome d ubiquinol oxidase subunit II [Amycolatopsis sp. NPDC021455]|uniref:cytochrome d ubiquinol oxidase subunit II n=1 Tax=Amycolatopsis sp. NPDC021455 TaxID=3154901 RepID=UPI00340E1A69